jgi:flagellar export protein FliJ
VPFRYRLDKVLKYRIQKRDEQQNVVREAQNEVHRIQAEIDKNRNSVAVLRKSIRSAPHTLMESYDVYIKHLNEVIAQLEIKKEEAIQKLNEEKEKLAEMEKGVKVLEKHKEKMLEQYKEEEKQAEMKVLNEVAGQKHFAKMQERMLEQLEEEEKELLE